MPFKRPTDTWRLVGDIFSYLYDCRAFFWNNFLKCVWLLPTPPSDLPSRVPPAEAAACKLSASLEHGRWGKIVYTCISGPSWIEANVNQSRGSLVWYSSAHLLFDAHAGLIQQRMKCSIGFYSFSFRITLVIYFRRTNSQSKAIWWYNCIRQFFLIGRMNSGGYKDRKKRRMKGKMKTHRQTWVQNYCELNGSLKDTFSKSSYPIHDMHSFEHSNRHTGFGKRLTLTLIFLWCHECRLGVCFVNLQLPSTWDSGQSLNCSTVRNRRMQNTASITYGLPGFRSLYTWCNHTW